MYLIIFILGITIGSFLNVCIYRIPREESIAFPSSHCTNCGYNLKAYDLIPIFSYIFLRGRCRKCNEKISIIYPLIELLNGIIYVVIFYFYGISISTIFLSIFSSLLIVISAIDFKTMEVYTSTIVFGLILAIIYITLGAYFNEINYKDKLLGCIVGFLIIFLIVKITRGMGEGDYEIAALCGLFLGLRLILVALFLGIVIAGIAASIILILKVKGRKSEIAFGPYIALGTFISMILGDSILQFYLGFFVKF
ncbi:prepilin peptidase [Clostridium isatidis]|uniref:Peptidase A24 n=1 Tax=Clostridium isatidis TaxID=182773 RepID=A0A343J9T1_9CLOT|nr:A24 family peptidase [Clostridium isatidis]ASW42289.1 peptidase A24 [Clostridium isatidis]